MLKVPTPVAFRPNSVIMEGCHGGSQTTSTSASSTPARLEQRLLRAPTDAFMHRAAGGGERHHHGHFLAGDGDAVNQTQVHDVTAQFRVNNLAQGFKDGLFGDFVCRHAVLGKVEIGRGNG